MMCADGSTQGCRRSFMRICVEALLKERKHKEITAPPPSPIGGERPCWRTVSVRAG